MYRGESWKGECENECNECKVGKGFEVKMTFRLSGGKGETLRSGPRKKRAVYNRWVEPVYDRKVQ